MSTKTSVAPSPPSPAIPPDYRAKHLPLVPPAAAAPPDLVPARMINEALYCERLMFLEWVQGEFADNRFTVEGRLVHNRADEPGGKLPPLPADSDDDTAAPCVSGGDEPPTVARSVWLSSEEMGITAKIDVVEGNAAGEVVPIEYKRGHPPPSGEPWLPERAQLAAQAMLLREHGYRCDQAAIYYAGARRRVSVLINDDLLHVVRKTVTRIRTLTAAAETPPPLEDDRRCNGCSLIGICLPDETLLLRDLATGVIQEPPEVVEEPPFYPDLDGPLEEDPWNLAGEISAPHLMRRLHPARDEKVPLYVQEQGSQIGLDGECLHVRRRGAGVESVPLPLLSQVALLGNVQMTTQAMRAVLERGLPISFFSYGGWYYGRARGLSSKNVDLRLAQYRAASDPAFCVRAARGLVVGKIRNCRTMLRRNATGVSAVVLGELEQLAKKAEQAEALDSLLGLEGSAARVYFGAFTSMLRNKVGDRSFELDGRNRRPPRDPVNAMLSFGYALLTKDFTTTLDAVGLDPMLGFYHQTRFGRPALALDLMEEFRPLVADSVVIGVVNNGVLGPDDFVSAAAGVAIAPQGRRKFIQAYERRMDQLVTHPVFGYRISYRRVLEVQARLLGRVLMGEAEAYPSFRTR